MLRHAYSLLSQHALFATLDDDATSEIAGLFESVDYAQGQLVFSAGEPGGFAYLVERGAVRFLRPRAAGSVSLGKLGPGTFFGAHRSPDLWDRDVSCRVACDTALLRISRSDFERFLEVHPELQDGFDKSLEEVALLELLNLTEFMAALPSEYLMRIVSALSVSIFRCGETVVQEGARGDTMYIVTSGRLGVSKKIGNRHRRLAELVPGHFFGEQALFADSSRTATVMALTDTTCFTLDREHFEELSREIPAFASHMAHRAGMFQGNHQRARRVQDVVLVPLSRTQLEDLTGSHLLGVMNQGLSIDLSKIVKLLMLERLVEGLPPQQVARVINQGEVRRFAAGATVLDMQSANDGGLFVVTDGAISFVRQHGHRRDVAATLMPGEFFGALSRSSVPESLLDAAYVAEGVARCLCLPPEAIASLRETVSGWDAHLERLAKNECQWLTSHRHDPRPHPRKTRGDGRQRRVLPRRQIPESEAAKQLPAARRGRYPWVSQRCERDCGVASLSMITRYHGDRMSYAQLRQMVDVLPSGVNLLGITHAAERLGYRWGVLHGDAEMLYDVPLPAIIHWKDSHYVVLYHVSPTSVLVGDPAIGLVRLSWAKLLESWRGKILTITPAALTDA